MQLEINDQLVDLPAGKGLVRLQNAVAAVGELQTRTGEYSWPITLPPTRRNATVFTAALLHPQALGKFTASYRFRLSAGGQVWTGAFRLSSLKAGYTGSLSTDALGWARALGEKTLPELTSLAPVAYDGSQLEAILGLNCDQTDLQFPLLAWGNFFSPPVEVPADDETTEQKPASAAAVIDYPLSVDDYPPSVYLMAVLKAIFAEAGYFLQGPILSDADVRSWCLTAAGSAGDFWPWGLLLPARSELPAGGERHYSNYGTGGAQSFSNSAEFDEGQQVQYFQLHTTRLLSGATRAMSPAGGSYTAPRAGSYGFRWEAVISAISQQVLASSPFTPAYFAGFAPVAVGLVAFRSGEGYEGADGGVCTTGTGQFEPGQQRVLSYARLDVAGGWGLRTGTFSGELPTVYLEAGDSVQLLVFCRRLYSVIGDGIVAHRRRTFEFTVSAATLECTNFEGPLLLEPAKVLPTIKQVDLVKDFLLRTNTVPVANEAARTVTLLSRSEHTASLGPPVDLDSFADPKSLEFLPVLAGFRRVVFRPAEDSDDVVAGVEKDVVSIELPSERGESEKTIPSPFAAWGTRFYSVLQNPAPGNVYTVSVLLPCTASQDALDTPRSEANAPDVASRTPRLVRYLGPDGLVSVPWLRQGQTLPLARADYGGALAWEGDAGAVATRYREFLAGAVRGHLGKVSAFLTPQRYAALMPGRRVLLLGAEYTIEQLTGFQPDNPTAPTALTLLRRI